MGPMMLTLKVLPQLSSATTSFMGLLTSSNTTLHFIMCNQVPYAWAGIVFFIGLSGGFTGRSLALYVTNRLQRPSVTVFMLLFVLTSSIGLTIFHMATKEATFKFKELC